MAGRLALGWSAALLVVGVFLLLVFPLAVQSANRAYCENGDHPGPCPNAVELFGPALVVLAGATWCLVASVGFRRRRAWARPAVVVTFSLLAIGALVALVHEIATADRPQTGAVATAFGLMSYFLATAGLARREGRA